MKNGGNKVTMSEGVVYADVMFTKPQRTERKDDAAEAYCQVELKDKPRRCNPVTVVLLTLCVLLMGAVIGLGVLWNNKCPKHRVCASGWEFHGSKCYFFSTNKMNWTQSRDNCVSMGGHLVIINSLEEQTFLGDKVGSEMHEDEGKFWIGLTDGHHEGCWLWVDNTTLDLKKRSRRQQSKQRCPDIPLPRHFLQLFRGDTEAFPGQPGDIVPPACPRSSPGSPPGGTGPEH
uniref:C-type lectin domain-containing protein n=1 Tax=Esox lucius TaxID=8010 RepID=A0A6Q2WUE3_ESOLU